MFYAVNNETFARNLDTQCAKLFSDLDNSLQSSLVKRTKYGKQCLSNAEFLKHRHLNITSDGPISGMEIFMCILLSSICSS